jgi:hypothetical protein
MIRKVSKKTLSFLSILSGKHFSEVVKNLEMLYYLLIISNLILKLLIAIYILFWIFVFQFHPLEFNFYINFDLYFYICFLFFPYYFLIEIFYLSNLILIHLLIFFLDLISIILIIIYFIWDNLWNYIFFSISFSFNFLICKICSSLF